MYHHTKTIATIAETTVKLDLEKANYVVFTTTAEHSPIDLIAIRNSNEVLRIQVKYRVDGLVPTFTCWSDQHGVHQRDIDTSLFDYFALVGPEFQIAYVPSTMTGKAIRWSLPDSHTPFHWWEDFRLDSVTVSKRQLKDFGRTTSRTGLAQNHRRKVIRPSKEELENLLATKPVTHIANQYGVSYNAVRKWRRSYGIN